MRRARASANPSWKPGTAPAGGEAPPAERWRSGSGTEMVRPKRSLPLVRIGLALALFFGIFCGLVYLSTWLSPAKGTCLVVIGAGYEDNLAVPHNVYGRKGLEALTQLAGTKTA